MCSLQEEEEEEEDNRVGSVNRELARAFENNQNTALDSKQPILLTATLITVASIVTSIATYLFWDLPFGNGTLQILLCTMLGMFLALPALFSIWAALGNHTWVLRIPLAMGSELLVFCVYVGTISFLESRNSEIYILFAGVTIFVTIVLQAPMWAARLWLGARIGRFTEASFHSSQFSIKHLLIATTLVAFAIPLIQWLVSIVKFDGSSGLPLQVIAGFCGIFVLMIGLVAMLSILFVFAPRLRLACAVILCLSCAGAPFAIAPLLPRVLGRPFTNQEFVETGLNVFTFSISLSITLIAALVLYHLIGFRMKAISSSTT